jgi:hypothetical protein
MVFIRWKKKRKDGIKYGYLVHNVREGNKVKQQAIYYLGRFPVITKAVLLAGVKVDTTTSNKKLESSYNKKFIDTSKWNEKSFYDNLTKLREERQLSIPELEELIKMKPYELIELEMYIANPEEAKNHALMIQTLAIKISRNKEAMRERSKKVLNYDKTMEEVWSQNKAQLIKFFKSTPDFVSLCKKAKRLEDKKKDTKEKRKEKLLNIDYTKISDWDLWGSLKDIRKAYGLRVRDMCSKMFSYASWYDKYYYKTDSVHYSKLESRYEDSGGRQSEWIRRWGKKNFDKNGTFIVKDKWGERNKKFIDACRKTLKQIQKERKYRAILKSPEK